MNLREKIDKRIMEYNLKYKGNYDFENLYLKWFMENDFFELKNLFDSKEELYIWANGAIKIQANPEIIFDFLKNNYNIKMAEKDYWYLGIKDDPDAYFHIIPKEREENEYYQFYKNFFNLNKFFNIFICPPGSQIRIGKHSQLNLLMEKLINERIPTFFERVSLKKYNVYNPNSNLNEKGMDNTFYVINSITF
jgi:hypothetical protein